MEGALRRMASDHHDEGDLGELESLGGGGGKDGGVGGVVGGGGGGGGSSGGSSGNRQHQHALSQASVSQRKAMRGQLAPLVFETLHPENPPDAHEIRPRTSTQGSDATALPASLAMGSTHGGTARSSRRRDTLASPAEFDDDGLDGDSVSTFPLARRRSSLQAGEREGGGEEEGAGEREGESWFGAGALELEHQGETAAAGAPATGEAQEDDRGRDKKSFLSLERRRRCKRGLIAALKIAFYAFEAPLRFAFKYTIPSVREVVTLPRSRRSSAGVCRIFLALVACLLWLSVGLFFLLEWLTGIGCNIGLSPTLMGLTFGAIGTTTPDAFMSFLVARAGGSASSFVTLSSPVYSIPSSHSPRPPQDTETCLSLTPSGATSLTSSSPLGCPGSSTAQSTGERRTKQT